MKTNLKTTIHFLATLVVLGYVLNSNANQCFSYYKGAIVFKASKEAPLILDNGLLTLPKNLTASDPFDVLGIKKGEKETEEQFDERLKKRTRKLLMTYHSDRAENVLQSMFADESTRKSYIKQAELILDSAFKNIKESYELVKTAELRENYKSGYARAEGENTTNDFFEGYFSKFIFDTGSSIIGLHLNDRSFTLQNVRPLIDSVRQARTLGFFNREQSLNNSYRVGYLKTAIRKARNYIKRTYPKEFKEESYNKSIEYFIVNHLGIFNHKFSFKDFLDVYEFGQHPKVKASIALAALVEVENHYKGSEKTSVKFAILSHLISDLHKTAPGFLRTLDGEQLMKKVTSEHSELRPALEKFVKVWLTDLPGFVSAFPGSKDDKAMLAFLDYMDLERNDLPIKYLESVAKGLIPSRARNLARELLRWDDIIAIPSF